MAGQPSKESQQQLGVQAVGVSRHLRELTLFIGDPAGLLMQDKGSLPFPNLDTSTEGLRGEGGLVDLVSVLGTSSFSFLGSSFTSAFRSRSAGIAIGINFFGLSLVAVGSVVSVIVVAMFVWMGSGFAAGVASSLSKLSERCLRCRLRAFSTLGVWISDSVLGRFLSVFKMISSCTN